MLWITAEDTYTVPTLCQGERGFDVAITGTSRRDSHHTASARMGLQVDRRGQFNYPHSLPAGDIKTLPGSYGLVSRLASSASGTADAVIY